MDHYKYFRIAGHLALFGMMFSAIQESHKLMEEHLPHIPEIHTVVKLQPRYLTVWAVWGQLIYASLALLCDISEVLGLSLPKWFTTFRYTWYAGMVVPGTMRMCLYWPIYFYDESLVIPAKLQLLMPPYINFCYHGLVFFYMFWEFLFLPKDAPKANKLSMHMAWTVHVAYYVVLFYTRYGDLGIWPYDILRRIEDSIFLHVLLGIITYVTFVSYNAQWTLKKALWKFREKSKVL